MSKFKVRLHIDKNDLVFQSKTILEQTNQTPLELIPSTPSNDDHYLNSSNALKSTDTENVLFNSSSKNVPPKKINGIEIFD